MRGPAHAQIRPASRSAALAVAAALALAGCGGVDADVNDLDTLPVLTARDDVRIGDFDDPSLGFSRVYQAEVDRDGSLYVLEALVPEIRLFSPDGALGGGPRRVRRAVGRALPDRGGMRAGSHSGA